MASSIVTEESYGFNLEWIAEGSGIGEEICGVDKDCIVVPPPHNLTKCEPVGVEEHLQEVDDYVEIQVTEEEVVTDQWQAQQNGVEEDPLNFRVEGHDEVIVPLPVEQDEYSRLHPYPCDFCSRRFGKKSALTTHMISHQVEKTHGCNMCGAQYRRKHDLVEHMKIHAYAPERSVVEEDYEDLATVPQAKAKQRARRKKGRVVKSSHTSLSEPEVIKPPRRSKKSSVVDVPPEEQNHFVEEEEEVSLVPALVPPVTPPRFPIIDPSRPYVCQHCGVGFAREKALTSHTMIHVGDSAYECDRCHEMFQSSDQLRDHDATKHGRYYMSGNKRRSSGTEEKFGSFQCDQCGSAFHWYNQLKKHRRMHSKSGDDSGSEGLMCSLCGLVCSSHEDLELHRENHDHEMGVHSCDICGEVFDQLDDLRDHVKIRHKSSHSCRLCDSVFKDAKALSKHSLTHIESRTYPCSVCNRRFHNRGKLKKHMSMHEDQKRGLVCNECSEEFPDGRTLISHRQSVHGVNMSRLFPCVECGKTFSSRSSQQIHVRIHTGEKPYGCRFCWKAFADGGTLRKHERIHTGEKPYVCPVCSKAFNQRVVLREHVRAHHSGAESRLSTNCYECVVCGQMFGTSSELCLHLVHHSDENTAKHRLPNSGARKYGRRKKYNPPFSQPQFNHPDVQSDLSDSSHDSTDFKDKNKSPPVLSKRPKFGGEENLDSVVKLGESALENLNSMVGKPNAKRARIVRSGKKGFPKGNNKRFIKGKGKAARLMSNTSYASKYVVSRPECEMVSSMFEEGLGEGSEDVNGDTPPPRTRPRTKNVSYHNTKVESKFELATFPLQPDIKNKRTRRVSKVKIKKEEPQIDTQFINGIDPSMFEDNNHSGEQIETCIVDDIGVELKLEVKTSEPDFPMPETVAIKTELDLVSCEMCSEVFTNRSELLKHIQVHI